MQVKLWDPAKNEKTTFSVDDTIPCNKSGTPLFTTPNGEELWVFLLEKAFAKTMGDYASLEGGESLTVLPRTISLAVVTLTGIRPSVTVTVRALNVITLTALTHIVAALTTLTALTIMVNVLSIIVTALTIFLTALTPLLRSACLGYVPYDGRRHTALEQRQRQLECLRAQGKGQWHKCWWQTSSSCRLLPHWREDQRSGNVHANL